jgi:hypothetical protein
VPSLYAFSVAVTPTCRLGIFVGGRLQCLGDPKGLVSRFGGYMSFTITTLQGQVGTVV